MICNNKTVTVTVIHLPTAPPSFCHGRAVAKAKSAKQRMVFIVNRLYWTEDSGDPEVCCVYALLILLFKWLLFSSRRLKIREQSHSRDLSFHWSATHWSYLKRCVDIGRFSEIFIQVSALGISGLHKLFQTSTPFYLNLCASFWKRRRKNFWADWNIFHKID